MGWYRRRHRPWRRQGRLLLLLALSALALWTTASRSGRAAILPAARPTAAAPSATLRLQTLNVFGLPWPLAPDVEPRCRRIADRVAAEDVDVIALQEAWGEDASAPFAMPEHHRASCCTPASLFGSSGLMTLSRHPIRHAETRVFAAAVGIERLVSKGVLRTIVALPDGDLDVWNLHLQSGLADVAVRRAQIDELLRWLVAAADQPRQVVLGDFNCGPGDAEFAHLVDGLRALGFVHASCGLPTYDATQNPLAMAEAPREIDHLFVRGHRTAPVARRVYDRPIDGLLPSDHFGVEATVALEPRPRDAADYESRR